MERGKIWRHFDFWLLGAVALLIIFGIAMIRSATYTSPDPAVQQLTSRQILYTVIGAIILFAVCAIDYRFWRASSTGIYILLLALLAIVEVIGITTFGAQRWIDLGFIRIQPSELGKFLIVLTLSNYAAANETRIADLKFVLASLVHVGIPAGLVFIEPDLSTTIIYGVIWFAILWVAGLRPKHMAIFASAIALAAPVSFVAIFNTPQMRYMADRVVLFLLPNTESEAHQSASYNINQALISIGSGGLFGQGYGHGSQVQLRFLKVRHTDFIFSAIAHEFGFIGAMLVILLIAFVAYRIFRAARLARDLYGRSICYGVGAIILYQSFFNIAMNMNMLPVSGLPLPFVSYGGSSLWTFLFGIGLVESVILRHKTIEF